MKYTYYIQNNDDSYGYLTSNLKYTKTQLKDSVFPNIYKIIWISKRG